MTEISARELLAELVRCPSVNPGDRERFSSPYGEARLVSLLAEKLTSWGAQVTVADVAPGRPNLVARFAGRDRSKALLFDAHTDTVSHLNMAIEPFAAEIRDDCLFGRGACDTKGPMAAMLIALKSVVDRGGPWCDVVFAATCNEENGATGARHLAESGIQADFAVIAEPTNLKFVIAHKGVVRAHVTTVGRAAHSSRPEDGVNAIYAMLPVASALQSLAGQMPGRPGHHTLGSPSLAVTTIEGGTAVNIIPERCTLRIDRRLLPGEAVGAAKAEIEAVVEAALSAVNDTEFTVEWTSFYPPMSPAEECPELNALEGTAREVTGSCQRCTAQYGTNGGFYAAAGIPCVVFGPGDISQAHTAEEYIRLEEVEAAAEIFRRFLAGNWQAGPGS